MASSQSLTLDEGTLMASPNWRALAVAGAVGTGSSSDDGPDAVLPGAVVVSPLAAVSSILWIMLPWTVVGVRRGVCPRTATDPPGGSFGPVAFRIAQVKRSFCLAINLQSVELWEFWLPWAKQ